MIPKAMVVDVMIQENFFDPSSPSPSLRPPWKEWFQTWISALSPNLPGENLYELTLRLTDDEEIQCLNHQYRGKDSPTDVLAFAALEVNGPPLPSEEPLYLGDIIISVPTASRQAQEQAHSLTCELSWLATHGLLHLLGWDHPDESSLQDMLTQQQMLLNLTPLRD